MQLLLSNKTTLKILNEHSKSKILLRKNGSRTYCHGETSTNILIQPIFLK